MISHILCYSKALLGFLTVFKITNNISKLCTPILPFHTPWRSDLCSFLFTNVMRCLHLCICLTWCCVNLCMCYHVIWVQVCLYRYSIRDRAILTERFVSVSVYKRDAMSAFVYLFKRGHVSICVHATMQFECKCVRTDTPFEKHIP